MQYQVFIFSERHKMWLIKRVAKYIFEVLVYGNEVFESKEMHTLGLLPY